jgi:nucleotide-binding universal stress UspA family protein
MMTLLVPVDGSKNSLRAVKYAAAQSKHCPVMLHIVNVEPPLDEYGMVRAYVSRQQHDKAVLARAATILARATARVRRSARVRCKTRAVIGDAPAVIANLARRLKCDSIVMGTRGMTLLGNLVLGSVATKVVHIASVPVTLVK